MKSFLNVCCFRSRVAASQLMGMLTVASLASTLNAIAQNTDGITGVTDTSYANYGAFIQTRKEHPAIKLVQLANLPSVSFTQNISYDTIQKRVLQLDIFEPAGKKASGAIAVLIIHGGGWRSGNRTQHHPLAEQLAAKGYVCFTPEYRLSTEALFPAAIYDIKAAIRWVKSHADIYGIDTGKLVIMGFSAGGEMAAFMGTTGNMPLFEGPGTITQISSQVNAVVDIDGTLSFVHPEGGEGDDSKGVSAATHWFGYPKKDKPVLWEAASPLAYVGSKTPPTLFLNSAVSRMHAGREDYIKVLNEHGIYSEVFTFEGAPHSFCLFDPWFQPTLNYIDGFLKKVFNSTNNQE